MTERDDGTLRTFSTGATRDTAEGKYDYEGFISPLAWERFAEYMHKNRKQSDGSIRDSDNWQKGIPLNAYMKSMFRHFMAVWRIHRSSPGQRHIYAMEEALCGIFFNAQGYLHELIKLQQQENMAQSAAKQVGEARQELEAIFRHGEVPISSMHRPKPPVRGV